jgi:RNA12 protein
VTTEITAGGLKRVSRNCVIRTQLTPLLVALPAKPLVSIALADADPASSLSFVQDRLKQYGVSPNLTRDQTIQIERLGGRSSDLEAVRACPCLCEFADLRTQLCHKVKNGMPVEMAVEDIITRGVGELRKNAFGEIEDAQSMAWSREQVFFILKALAKSDEVSFVR